MSALEKLRDGWTVNGMTAWDMECVCVCSSPFIKNELFYLNLRCRALKGY